MLLGAFSVDCDMTSDPEYIKAIVHHDSEYQVYVSGYDNVDDYIRPVFYYGANTAQITALKNSSLFCRQYLQVHKQKRIILIFSRLAKSIPKTILNLYQWNVFIAITIIRLSVGQHLGQSKITG